MASHSDVQQQFATFTLPELMRQIYRGNLLLHRDDDATWDDARRVELFEAIYHGVPMGGITLCRTLRRLAHADELGGIPVGDGDEDEGTTPRNYVLEGSDRLRVLFEIFGESFWLVDRRPGRRPRAKNTQLWTRITFDLRNRAFRLQANEPNAPWECSLSSIMHAEDRHHFSAQIESRIDGERLVTRFNKLVSAFYEYPVPVTTFVSNDAKRISLFLSLRNGRKPSSPGPVLDTTSWVCDECKTWIVRPEDGVVQWLDIVQEKEGPTQGKKLCLVHQAKASPRRNGCEFSEDEFSSFYFTDCKRSLIDFLSDNGLTLLLSFLSRNYLPKAEILELIKRLYTPGYERARFHFKAAQEEGVIKPTGVPGVRSTQVIAATLEWADKKKRKP